MFDGHFRAAQGLLKVYRLLEREGDDDAVLIERLRGAMDVGAEEGVVLLFNDLVTGLVRERAEMPMSFFRHVNLALLLRQAVVSACTAMDVFLPALLEAHLPEVIRVRQRNWQPSEGTVKKLFEDFSLRVEELPGLLEAETIEERWQIFASRVLAHMRRKTLSNPEGIQGTMVLLGVQDPWQKIASRSGMTPASLRQQVQTVVNRRNSIVHRGDRPPGQVDETPEPIDYAWANAHINAVNSTVTACDALAQEAVRALKIEAGIA